MDRPARALVRPAALNALGKRALDVSPQGILLETLRHVLATVRRPEAGFEIVLAYNSPVELPIEQDLSRWLAVWGAPGL